MKLKQLSYAVQKEHTIPYLPHVFYTITVLFLCILIPINVALAGSDVVTTLRRDPNSIEKPWWAPSFWPEALTLRVPDICQPQSISDDPTLRTNSTAPIFKYALRSASGPGGESKDPSQRIYPVPYMANPLSDCKVENIIWQVTVPIRAMSYKVTISCKLIGQKEFGNFRVPDNIKLSTVHYRIRNTDLGPDDMKEYLSFNLSPGQGEGGLATENPLETLGSLPADPTSPNNIIAVLDGMQTDLYHAIWTQLHLWALRNRDHRNTYVIEWFAGPGDNCRDRSVPTNKTLIPCGDAADPNRIVRWYGTNDWGNVTGPGSFLPPFNTSIINMMVALQDAIMIDLGSADPASNIFLNKTYFNGVVKLDPFHKASEAPMLNTTDNWKLSSEGYWNFCSSWSCIPTSWAQALRDASESVPVRNIMLPYKPNSQAHSVFGFSYLCPTFKPKSINSLLLSVFVATASTLSALYALFCYVMPLVEEKYQRRKRAMKGAINADLDEQEEHPLVCLAGAHGASKMPFGSPVADMNRYRGTRLCICAHEGRLLDNASACRPAALIYLPVALVGSDVVTLLRSDPITVEKPWWAPKFWPEALTPDPPDICQLQSINDDPTLRTNSSVPIFKYALRSANSPSGEESDDPSKRVYPTPYMANPLANCTVQNILWRVDVPIRIMSYRVTIGCALTGQKEFGDVRIPDSIKLFTIHHRTFNSDVGPDDMKEYLSFNLASGQNDGTQLQAKPVQSLTNIPADSSSSNNVISVLDGLQTDLLHAIWTQLILWDGRYRGTYLVEWIAGAGNKCRTQQLPFNYSVVPCGDATDPNRLVRWYGNTNDWGGVNGTADFLRPFNTSIINTFIGLQDAIAIDLGSADAASNIFLNKTYFNRVIKPDPYHKDAEALIRNTTGVQVPEFYWRFCSYWGCTNTPWTQTLRDTPEDVPLQNVVLPYKPNSQDPSVFNFSYLCPIFKRKPITSLLLSVFVATVSTMSALYGLFCYVMPSVEKGYQKRQQAKRNKIAQDPEKQDHLLEQGSNASNSCRTSISSSSERGMNKDIDPHSFSTMYPNPRRRTN